MVIDDLIEYGLTIHLKAEKVQTLSAVLELFCAKKSKLIKTEIGNEFEKKTSISFGKSVIARIVPALP